MFSRDLILSVILHVVIFSVTLFAGALDVKRPPDLGSVITVRAVSMPEMEAETSDPVPEAETPLAVQAEPEEIVLEDPTTKPAAEIEEPIEDPKPKPLEEKPKPKPPPSAKTTEPGEKDRAGAEEGQTEIEAPAGSGISGMVIGSSNFNFPHWPSLAFSKISRYFYFSISIDGKVYCDVRFEVIKSGKVILSEVVSSSGIPSFDNACLAAIERASPLPPLPREWLDEHIEITVTFTNP